MVVFRYVILIKKFLRDFGLFCGLLNLDGKYFRIVYLFDFFIILTLFFLIYVRVFGLCYNCFCIRRGKC